MPCNSRTIALLERLRDTLHGYATNHMAKSPPQIDKALTNLKLVVAIDAELLRLGVEQANTVSVRVPDCDSSQAAPSIRHMTEFVESLAGRDAEDLVAIRAPLGELRVLLGVDER